MIFQIVSNVTLLTAREITYNNFEMSLVVFIPNITTNHAITYTNHSATLPPEYSDEILMSLLISNNLSVIIIILICQVFIVR